MRGVRRSLALTEPATTLTDFLIAAMCVVFVLGLAHGSVSLASPRGLWAASFATTAVAATVGGVVHGFALRLTSAAKQRLWKATQYAMGLTGLAILSASVVAFVGGGAQRWLLALALAKFLVFAAVVARRDDYAVVVADYGVSMLAMAGLACAAWLRGAAPAPPWLLAGVAVSAAAAVVQLAKVTPHPRFNHNDLYHVIQLAALYLFYRGGLLLAGA